MKKVRKKRKSEKYTEEQDGRVRLTTQQKEAIKARYDEGGVSWNDLAKQYNVSKRLIGFIVNPDTREKVKATQKANWKSYKPSTEERRVIMRKYREKKRKLGLYPG